MRRAWRLALLTACFGFALGCGGDDDNDDSDAGDAGDSHHDGDHDAHTPDQDASTDEGDDPPIVIDAGAIMPMCGRGVCELTDSSGCVEGNGCRFLLPMEPEDGEEPSNRCERAGDGVHGDSCTRNTDCGASLECADGVCRQYCCAEGEDQACPSGTTCTIEKQTGDREPTGVFLCGE